MIVYWVIYRGVDIVSKYFDLANWSECLHIIFNTLLLTFVYRDTAPLVIARTGNVLDTKFEDRSLALREKVYRLLEKYVVWRRNRKCITFEAVYGASCSG